ncbi:tetratricopeptide repeat protein [Pseudoroseomonas cervicalis]|uniref:tetratricopeptide repeat protein n=1 Tax=Teichococcus cervicalis TaxID=204525 RepID=UPI0027893A3B|nr:tetratricopeptide repeat protein [Pseudoroseomonas cervicalis]MDQ1078097.1 putative Zn-dependent protease [Pseudoroseomonas cervicalis]
MTGVALLEQAEAALRRGDGAEAEALLRRAAEGPRPGRARLRLARLLLDQERLAEAEAPLQALLSAQPAPGEALGLLAELRQRQGALAEAEAALRQWQGGQPEALSPALALARLLRHQGRDAAALAGLQAARLHHPDNPKLLLPLAELLQRCGRPAEAAPLLARLGTVPHGPASGLRLAKLLLAAEQPAAAETLLRSLAEQAPRPAVLEMLGRLLERRGQRAEAEAVQRRLLAAADDPVPPALRLARRLTADGRVAEAAALLQARLADAPEQPQLLLALARLRLRQHEDEAALALFERAVAQAGAPAEAWIGLARASARLLPMVEVLERLRRARRVAAPHPGLDRELASKLLRFGAWDEAERLLATARARFPEDAELLRLRQRLVLLKGGHAEAEALIQDLPAATPAQRQLRLRLLAGLRKAQWRLEEALALQEQASAAEGAQAQDFRSLAELRLMTLDTPGARRALARALQLDRHRRQSNVSQSLAGEILNDFATDSEALEAARAARGLQDWRQVLDSFPHHTGCAMAFLIALRREGLLAPRPAGSGQAIPRRIHQFWDAPPPPADVAALVGSWQACNPGWEHRLYSAEAARGILAAQPDARLLRAFRRLPSVTGQADLFRLALLFSEGGVYADADDRCVAPLDGLVAGRELVLRQEHYGSAGNNIIAVRPRHPVIGAALEQAVQAVLRGDRESIWLSSGPGLLTRCLAAHLAADAAHLEQLGQGVLLLDLHEMQRHCVSGCNASYKQSPDYWQAREFQRQDGPAAR